MFGITLILTLAVMGGVIAYIGDKLGFKLGKKRLSIFGLRPRNTSTLFAVLSGVVTAAVTLGALSLASNDVRTALFGMEKLKQELVFMSDEVATKNKDLLLAKEQLQRSKNDVDKANLEREQAKTSLSVLEIEQRKVMEDLSRYRKESEEFGVLRDKLQKEVSMLQKETNDLEAGVIKLREGEVVFRAKQVLYAGTLRAGQSEKDTAKALSDFLSFANNSIASKLGIKNDTQIIFVAQESLSYAMEYLMKNTGSVAIRLQSAGNILLGEPVFTEFTLYPNKLIYKNGEEIYMEKIKGGTDKKAAESILIAFLSRLNAKAVSDGILPDPLTGNIGNIELPYMMEVVDKIRSMQGDFSLTAIPDKDIQTLGPLEISIIVKSDI